MPTKGSERHARSDPEVSIAERRYNYEEPYQQQRGLELHQPTSVATAPSNSIEACFDRNLHHWLAAVAEGSLQPSWEAFVPTKGSERHARSDPEVSIAERRYNYEEPYQQQRGLELHQPTSVATAPSNSIEACFDRNLHHWLAAVAEGSLQPSWEAFVPTKGSERHARSDPEVSIAERRYNYEEPYQQQRGLELHQPTSVATAPSNSIEACFDRVLHHWLAAVAEGSLQPSWEAFVPTKGSERHARSDPEVSIAERRYNYEEPYQQQRGLELHQPTSVATAPSNSIEACFDRNLHHWLAAVAEGSLQPSWEAFVPTKGSERHARSDPEVSIAERRYNYEEPYQQQRGLELHQPTSVATAPSNSIEACFDRNLHHWLAAVAEGSLQPSWEAFVPTKGSERHARSDPEVSIAERRYNYEEPYQQQRGLELHQPTSVATAPSNSIEACFDRNLHHWLAAVAGGGYLVVELGVGDGEAHAAHRALVVHRHLSNVLGVGFFGTGSGQ